ncbi:MAG TPA: hypothetical protein VHF25_17110 [Nitriliruptorales bacterium]|nr:hypothetical protein [Nitriliruptorales bacterium]
MQAAEPFLDEAQDPNSPQGSTPDDTRELNNASRFTTLVSDAIVGAYLLIGGVALAIGWGERLLADIRAGLVGRSGPSRSPGWSRRCAVLHIRDDKGSGIFRPLIGGDNRCSTSLMQIGLWTVLVATALAFLLGRVVFEARCSTR